MPWNYTSTILASSPSKMVESIMKNKTWVSVACWKQVGMASIRGNCASPVNGQKKHPGKGDSVDVLGFSENLWQGYASEPIKKCDLSEGWMRDLLMNRKQREKLKGRTYNFSGQKSLSSVILQGSEPETISFDSPHQWPEKWGAQWHLPVWGRYWALQSS